MHLDDLRLAGIELLQLLQGFVQRQNILALPGRESEVIVKLNADLLASMLAGDLLAGVIDRLP
jgi:hypothetical protein